MRVPNFQRYWSVSADDQAKASRIINIKKLKMSDNPQHAVQSSSILRMRRRQEATYNTLVKITDRKSYVRAVKFAAS